MGSLQAIVACLFFTKTPPNWVKRVAKCVLGKSVKSTPLPLTQILKSSYHTRRSFCPILPKMSAGKDFGSESAKFSAFQVWGLEKLLYSLFFPEY